MHGTVVRRIVSALILVLILSLLVARPVRADGGYTFRTLYSFTGGTDGQTPQATLVLGLDGNLYGTTPYGGNVITGITSGLGTVFKITPLGKLTTLYSFTDGADGARPFAGLVQGSDGNFYGTTFYQAGTVFKLTPAGKLTTLFAFAGGTNGTTPDAGLVQGADGDFYGTTEAGGADRSGTVFKISPAGKLTTIYAFTGGTDGGEPAATLVRGRDGEYYGTTPYGGSDAWGTVFKVTSSGVMTTLYSFTDGSDGGYPPAGLIQGSDGNFYGTTNVGGAKDFGTVFKITPGGTLTTLYSFTDGSDGGEPFAGLTEGMDGNFYGTTSSGGSDSCGTVFEITPSGALTTIYAFTDGTDGGVPLAGLVTDTYGNLYGTAAGGGAYGAGTVFELAVKTPTPTLTSLSLTGATLGGAATTITLMGSGFVSGAQVEWNGVALKTTYVSSSKLTATIPASDLSSGGIYNIAVLNPGSGGVTGSSLAFTVNNPIPSISTLTPGSVMAGAATVTLTLTGAKFVSGAKAQWSGIGLTTTYVSATKLTATVPATYLTAADTFSVTVVNPAPGGGASKPAAFTVYNPVPTLKSVSPTSATVGAPATTVMLIGTNIVRTSFVRWAGIALATTYVSPTSLTATVPASSLAKAGAFGITVVNPAPAGGTSKAVSFVVNNLAPTFTSISPNSATVGAAALKVTVTGVNVASGAVVKWNGATLATTYSSATTLTATVPASDLAKAGSFNLTVSNPAPGGGASAAVSFTVNNATPTLSKLSRVSAAVGSANVTVTATGTGFQTTSKAQWDGVALATTYKSATTLTFVVPKADLVAAGTHGITVMNPTPGGGTSGPVTFTVE